MKRSRRNSSKIKELEKRIEALEAAEASRKNTIGIKNPVVPIYPLVAPTLHVLECMHEFPSHYYSPNGYYPCMKCGKSFFCGTTIITYTSNTPSVPDSNSIWYLNYNDTIS